MGACVFVCLCFCMLCLCLRFGGMGADIWAQGLCRPMVAGFCFATSANGDASCLWTSSFSPNLGAVVVTASSAWRLGLAGLLSASVGVDRGPIFGSALDVCAFVGCVGIAAVGILASAWGSWGRLCSQWAFFGVDVVAWLCGSQARQGRCAKLGGAFRAMVAQWIVVELLVCDVLVARMHFLLACAALRLGARRRIVRVAPLGLVFADFGRVCLRCCCPGEHLRAARAVC